MPDPTRPQGPTQPSRRDFLKTSSASAALAVGGTLALERAAHAAGDDALRVGLIGCGGRGMGAAGNVIEVMFPVLKGVWRC